jgi:hypothetical protein
MTELESLKAKRDARKGKPEYAENVREIEARIAELEAENADA